MSNGNGNSNVSMLSRKQLIAEPGIYLGYLAPPLLVATDSVDFLDEIVTADSINSSSDHQRVSLLLNDGLSQYLVALQLGIETYLNNGSPELEASVKNALSALRGTQTSSTNVAFIKHLLGLVVNVRDNRKLRKMAYDFGMMAALCSLPNNGHGHEDSQQGIWLMYILGLGGAVDAAGYNPQNRNSGYFTKVNTVLFMAVVANAILRSSDLQELHNAINRVWIGNQADPLVHFAAQRLFESHVPPALLKFWAADSCALSYNNSSTQIAAKFATLDEFRNKFLLRTGLLITRPKNLRGTFIPTAVERFITIALYRNGNQSPEDLQQLAWWATLLELRERERLNQEMPGDIVGHVNNMATVLRAYGDFGKEVFMSEQEIAARNQAKTTPQETEGEEGSSSQGNPKKVEGSTSQPSITLRLSAPMTAEQIIAAFAAKDLELTDKQGKLTAQKEDLSTIFDLTPPGSVFKNGESVEYLAMTLEPTLKQESVRKATARVLDALNATEVLSNAEDPA